MALKPCLDCGALGPASRCDTHRKAKENQRNRISSTHNGNYGDHRRWREHLALTLPAYCWYGCGRLLTTDDRWVAAHVIDGDPTSPRVVSCPRCNENAK